MVDRQQALNKKGTLTDGEIKSLEREWHNVQTEAELNQATMEMEVRAMEKKLHRYNVALLGNIPMEREDGTMRILVSQMGGCASVESGNKDIGNRRSHPAIQN
jgi:hypothetical protein